MIRTLGTLLLFLLVTVLAIIAAWAGLNAWGSPAPRFAEALPRVERPTAPVVELSSFEPRGPRVVEATADLSSAARPASGTVEIRFVGTRGAHGPDRVAILDGRTRVRLVEAGIPADIPAVLTLDNVPGGEHDIVTIRDGESPRWCYVHRETVELDARTGPDAAIAIVELDVSVSRAVVRLEAIEVPRDRPWTIVSGMLARSDDARWSPRPAEGLPPCFGPGDATVDLVFDGLGSGRYELQLNGFAVDGPMPIVIPADRPIRVRGRPE